MAKVTIHTLEEVDVQGAHVIAAFPSIGLVATIAATFIVEELGLRQVGVMDSPRFPTLSVVQDGEPLSPVRIYAGTSQGTPVVVFLSEFQPHPDLVRPVSESIIDWAKQHGAAAIVAPEGLMLEGDGIDRGIEVFTAASTVTMRERLAKAECTLFKEGIVAGVTGVLLNLGRRDDYPVAAVLSEAQQGQPDARSAAAVVDLLAGLMGIELSTHRLYDEADAFDAQVDEVVRRKQLQDGESTTPTSVMYG